jgi:hypothetical protein
LFSPFGTKSVARESDFAFSPISVGILAMSPAIVRKRNLPSRNDLLKWSGPPFAIPSPTV